MSYKLSNIWLPKFSDTLSNLELHMGDINKEENYFSYSQVIAHDESETFPHHACKLLNEWGLGGFYVPHEFGGKLTSFEALFSIMRLISRRDLTISIGHGKTYLGVSAVWVAGNQEQKKEVADLILNNGIISLGLTEKEHGSDLAANEFLAKYLSSSYSLSGQKWLINNATRGDALTLFAKTSEKIAARNYSIFFVQKKNISSEAYYHIPKIKTHGIRGADISGIGFKNVILNEDSLIGKEGAGLEIILKSLQISRTICSNLSLGAADTGLRSTLKFALNRNIYGNLITEIPYVKEEILNCFINILICESVSIFATRCLHICPELMSLYSSVTKYFVPKTIEGVFDKLAGILGARFYLRGAHDHGIFQKFVRDNSLVGLFDGSSIVNIQAISNQINFIEKKSKETLLKNGYLEKYKKIFSLDMDVDNFDPEKLSLSSQGNDLILYSFEILIKSIEEDNYNYSDQEKKIILKLINIIIRERDLLFTEISKKNYNLEKIDKEKESNILKYCKILAASCCAGYLHYNQFLKNSFINIPILLKHLLNNIVSSLCPKDSITQEQDEALLWEYLNILYRENRLFSLTPMQLN
jgi:alkylation response protein AidB-like acyl-CoA dehydrogenase